MTYGWKGSSVWKGVAIGLAVIASGVLSVEGYIGYSAYRTSRQAAEEFGGDRVEALIRKVECTSCKMADREMAVWALGQIGDQRALPALRTHLTGRECKHSAELCQYELQKAIRHIEKGIPLHSILRPKP